MNKIYHLFFALIFAVSPIFAQEFNDLKEASPDHALIDGTNVLMIPPADFKASENFKGFQNPEDPYSMIMLMEIPGPYQEISSGFNEAALKEKGMVLRSKKDILINEQSGMFLELDQEASGVMFSKYILLFGQETSTLINGVYLKESVEVGKKIKASMLSTFIDNNIEVDPRAVLKYSVDESVADLKFNAVMGNSILFNRDGIIPTESVDQLSLIIDEAYADVEITEEKIFCLGRLREAPGDFSLITQKGIQEVKINGLTGYEIYGKSAENVKEEAFQTILFKEDGGYYIFFATYIRGKGQSSQDVKKVIDTFTVN